MRRGVVDCVQRVGVHDEDVVGCFWGGGWGWKGFIFLWVECSLLHAGEACLGAF